MIATILLGSASGARAQSLEYQVKANYLVRFAAFVVWPASAFQTPASPVVLCVAGLDPFGRALDQAAAARTAHGRSLSVRRLGEQGSADGCHILYLGRGSAQAAAAVPGRLVVSDGSAGTRRAMIHFVIVSNRVRFHIDKASADQAGLVVSSRLLNLALDVQERS